MRTGHARELFKCQLMRSFDSTQCQKYEGEEKNGRPGGCWCGRGKGGDEGEFLRIAPSGRGTPRRTRRVLLVLLKTPTEGVVELAGSRSRITLRAQKLTLLYLL